MTEAEALKIRKAAASLYKVAAAEFKGVYYRLYNKQPGDEPFDNYVASMWEENPLQEALYELGSVGYKALIEGGWNPLKSEEETEQQ